MKIHINCTNKEAVITLVELRQKLKTIYSDKEKALWITISPNPKTRHKVQRLTKTYNMIYQTMTHGEQYNYLQSYMCNVYVPLMEHTDWIYIIYEYNADNNIHCHMMMYSKSIQDSYDIKALQKTIYVNPMTIINLKKGSNKDWMNNIVYLDESKVDEQVEYIQKDKDIKTIFPDNYIER